MFSVTIGFLLKPRGHDIYFIFYKCLLAYSAFLASCLFFCPLVLYVVHQQDHLLSCQLHLILVNYALFLSTTPHIPSSLEGMLSRKAPNGYHSLSGVNGLG